jgi:ATP-dependent helicase/nuclease subunit B
VERIGGVDPLALSEALVFVPTRRAVRNLREAFAEHAGGAALLPDIRALGDSDEDAFDPSAEDMAAVTAIAPLRRRLLLATLVERWERARGGAAPFAQAVAHAGELARFLDEAVTQGVDLTKLRSLAPDRYAEHWQQVVAFLDIVATEWPRLISAEGRTEPAALRDARLRALAKSLGEGPRRGPVIAAGSTGSIPATAELLKAIAHMPNGAVVAPALDTALDAASWDALDPSHAQYGLRQLLAYIGISREDVTPWPHLPDSYAEREVRLRFLTEALRPPPTTDAWRDLVENAAEEFAGALNRVSRIEASNPREEAAAIACALRETLETPSRTAALVTPDRGLARRVAAELSRWNIAIDDSAGRRLSATPPGAFLSLLARAAAEDFAPVSLLALLKHPFASGGSARPEFLRHVRALEIFALRGLRPEPGLAGIAARFAKNEKASEELKRWFATLIPLFSPLAEAMHGKDMPLDDIAGAHVKVAEALAATDRESGANVLWRGHAGESAANLLNELIRDGEAIALSRGHWYAELFRALAEERAVRPPYNRHPRLAILGPLEARLIHFDLLILGGLNEGSWPAEAATDPWLSRPMRKELGLEPPERRTGLAAHDFATLAANESVLLTRSLKDAGAPTVPSRWLLRVEQLAKGLKLEGALDARKDLVQWAREIDRGKREKRTPRPAPRPPVAARPRSLSITEIETWLRDPYAIYAKHVLGLKPLDPLDQEAGPRERGIAVHRALERFLKVFPAELTEDAFAQLLRLGDDAFAEAGATEAVLALWRPRFERAARWFLDYEKERRQKILRSAVEVKGDLAVRSAAGFTLRGRADRIDFFDDGSAAILDYKTGRVPSDTQIKTLLIPQLPLEAAMLKEGAFGELRAASIRELVHVQLTGAERAGEVRIAKVDGGAIAEEALLRLARLVERYENPAQPYLSRAMPERLADEGDYDHLARVAEWSLAGEDSE